MKKVLVLLSTLAVLAITLTSCTTLHYEYQESGDTLKVTQLAVKDYDIIAPCTVTATVTEKESLFQAKKDGSEIVYPALLEKAVELGGQDVINVRIAKKEDSEIKLYGFFGKEVTYTYTATALVIKYNNKNLETKAEYSADGKLTAVTGPVVESSTVLGKGSTGGLTKLLKKLKLFKK